MCSHSAILLHRVLLTGGVSVTGIESGRASSVTAICLQISDSRSPDGFGHCPCDESNLVSDLRAEIENAGSNPAEKLELARFTVELQARRGLLSFSRGERGEPRLRGRAGTAG